MSGFENEILQLERQIETMRSQLDTEMRACLDALPVPVKAWMRAEVARQIDQHAAKVSAAGPEGMRKLKSDLEALFSTLPEKCAIAFRPITAWPHHQLTETTVSERTKQSGESYFSSVFRTVINSLGPILDKHGLLRESAKEYQAWQKSGDKYRYAINPGFEPHSMREVQNYNELLEQLKSTVQSLQQKRGELAKVTARELWENA